MLATVVFGSITVAGGTVSAATIDRMDTDWFDNYQPSALPQPYFIVLGGAARYHLSDASSWDSGAGSVRPGWAFLREVSVDDGVARYLFDSAYYPSLFQHTDYDGGDHSAQGELGVFTPLVLSATIGADSGVLRGYTEILSNDETWYGEPRFNYYSAAVGDRVYFEQTVALYDAVFAEDLFTSEFGYRISGFVDFTRIYMTPEPGTLWLLGLGLAGIGVIRRQTTLPSDRRKSPMKLPGKVALGWGAPQRNEEPNLRRHRITLTMMLLALLPLPGGAFAITWDDGSRTHEYELVEYANISWPNAAAWIETNLGPGWYLATITSAAEQAFITQQVFAGRVGEYWIGGYQDPAQSVPAANWHWVTGEPWSYTNWSANEPNDNYGPGSESYLGANWEGCCWNDEGIFDPFVGFVAERATVPEPGMLALFGLALAGLGLSRRRRVR